MDKSIESIWKDGFLNNDALVAPKVNNIYNLKSKHIIAKFNRMFRRNLVLIIIGSILFFIYSIFADAIILGIGTFIISNAIVIVNYKLMKTLKKIDKNVSSYNYLKAFDKWIKYQLKVNRKMAKLYYPLFFITVILGIWFSGEFQLIISEILGNPHQIYLVNGFPVIWISVILLITSLLAIFGDNIYNFDVNLIYGRVFKKLNEIIADIEELRK